MLKYIVGTALFTLLLCSYSFAQNSMSRYNKDYHLIFIDLSQSKDRQSLTREVSELIDSIKESKDDFLLYLSNGDHPEMIGTAVGSTDIRDILSSLQTLNTSTPKADFDRDSILNMWGRNDLIGYDIENSASLNYNNIHLHYFISSVFFDLSENEIIYRMLLIKDLTKAHIIDPKRININIYFDGREADYFRECKERINTENFYGYEYGFNSY